MSSPFSTKFFDKGAAPITGDITQGDVYHVKPSTGSDSNDGTTPAKAFKTLAYAHSKMTANQNDICYFHAEHNTAGSTTDYQATALTWSKNLCHLIGVGASPMMGQRTRIAQLSTSLTITDLVTISANGCYIANLEIYQGVASSGASTERALVVSGQRNHVVNCQISGIGDTSMDHSGSCSLAVTGAENYFQHCYIGLETVIRATATEEVQIKTAATRTIFEDCIIDSYTSNNSFKALSITQGSYHAMTMLKNCSLCAVQNITSSTSPTGAIAHGPNYGQVWLQGTCVFGYDDVCTSTNTAILIASYGSGAAASVVDFGVGTAVTIS